MIAGLIRLVRRLAANRRGRLADKNGPRPSPVDTDPKVSPAPSPSETKKKEVVTLSGPRSFAPMDEAPPPDKEAEALMSRKIKRLQAQNEILRQRLRAINGEETEPTK